MYSLLNLLKVIGWGGGVVAHKILVTAQVLGFGIWDLDWTLDLGLSIVTNVTLGLTTPLMHIDNFTAILMESPACEKVKFNCIV